MMTQLDELFSQMVQKSKVAKSTASTSSHKEASATAKSKPRKLQFVDETFDSIESFDIGKLRRDSLSESNKNASSYRDDPVLSYDEEISRIGYRLLAF